MPEFIQDGPQLGNQYTDDQFLQLYLKQRLPKEMYDTIEPELINLGHRVITDIYQMGYDASFQPPELIQYDPWGNRIDEIKVSKGWEELKDVSATEGLIAIGYDRHYEEYSRIFQFAKLYLFTPSSSIYTCPLAMTDGAAQLLEIYGSENLKQSVLKKYTSREPLNFWVSGQWMTEKTGGSDLARTETIARKEKDQWLLYGPKWFTSAITAQTSMTLARIEEKDEVVSGSRGLSLFYLQIRDDENKWNSIRINRLKDKLGTRALPTAELDLRGTPAILIGEIGKGIKQISTMLNITRIYNSISAVSLMRRALALAKDYATKREAFEIFLIDLPLHAETLVKCEVKYTGSFLFIFYVIELLGKSECGKSNFDESKMLRLLTPIVKLYTGKESIIVISELLECMGGAGYLEDTGIPMLLRDAQVLSIWEGTTNVLSLDVLRSIYKESTFISFVTIMRDKLSHFSSNLSIEKDYLENELQKLIEYASSMENREQHLVETDAREFSFAIAKFLIGLLLVEFSNNISSSFEKTRLSLIAERWLEDNKIDLKMTDMDRIINNRTILGMK